MYNCIHVNTYLDMIYIYICIYLHIHLCIYTLFIQLYTSIYIYIYMYKKTYMILYKLQGTGAINVPGAQARARTCPGAPQVIF